MLWEAEYYEKALYRHLHYSFANEAGAKEDPERNQEVTAQEPSQVKQWVGYRGEC